MRGLLLIVALASAGCAQKFQAVAGAERLPVIVLSESDFLDSSENPEEWNVMLEDGVPGSVRVCVSGQVNDEPAEACVTLDELRQRLLER